MRVASNHLNSRFIGLFAILILLFGFPQDQFAERLPLETYTSADGLGSGFVDTLTRDSRGFMWFSTRDGLSRFDGKRFITYQVGAENSAPGIESVYETRTGEYWVGTTGGFYRFRSDALTDPSVHAARATLNAEFVSPVSGFVFEDRAGNLWLCSRDLYRIVEVEGKPDFQKVNVNLPDVPGKQLRLIEIKESSDGCFWIRTTLGVIRWLPDGRTVFYPYGKDIFGSLVEIMLDDRDRLWLTIAGELYILRPESIEELGGFANTKTISLETAKSVRLDKESLELPSKPGEVIRYLDDSFLEKHQMKFLFKSSDNHVWMTTGVQLAEFDGTRVRVYPKIPGTTNMRRLGEDIAGNIWISGSQNLIRLDRGGITTYDESDGLRSTNAFSVQEGRDGTIYVANGPFYLTGFNSGKTTTVTFDLMAESQPVWTARPAMRDSRGEFWLTSTEGLYRFPATDHLKDLDGARPARTYGVADGLKAKSTFQIFEDSHGTIWVSTAGNTPSEAGLARYDRASDRFKTFTVADGYPDEKSASSFVEDASGRLWIGFYQGGLVRYVDGRFEEFSDIEGIESTVVSDLLVDKKGRLWISTPKGGVYMIEDPSVRNGAYVRYAVENGLSSNNIRTIAADMQGNIYAGTARGVDRIAPDTGNIKHFSIEDGLASDFIVDSLCDRSGDVWFATMNGVSRLTPSNDEGADAPDVWIGGLTVAGVPQAVGELGSRSLNNLEFPYTQNNLQIEFFALDFAPNETLRYQYKLEGTDTDWGKPTENRSVNFANLAPGDYRFLVRSVNDSGVPNANPAAIVFKINAAFWRTRWFLTLVAAFCVAAFYLLYHYRVRSLQRVNQALTEAQIAEEKLLLEREKRLAEIELVRTRIATDLHDDIGSSLTQIAVLSEVARNQATAANGADLSKPLERIKGVSRELVETMADVVWAINPKKDYLRDLVQRMRRFASDVCAGRNIHFELEAPSSEEMVPLGANVRREVFAIFKESINNAVKYSECDRIIARFWTDDNCLKLEIEDDGRGFDRGKILSDDYRPENGGNGLANIIRRSAELGGNCRIDSRPGSGTSIVLNIPLSRSDSDIRPPTQSGGVP